jgi:concanavalin A-like lectin/glucanase superfamily protein
MRFRKFLSIAIWVVPLLACLVVVTLLPMVRAQNVTAVSTLCETGCLLPPTGLLGWWPGDGNARDIQLGNNGIIMNGATFASGLVKQAFSFDGSDAFIDVPDSPSLHGITTTVTVDAWINPEVQPLGEGWIFARRDPLVSEGVGLAINSDGFLTTQLQTAVTSDLASSVPVIQFNGEWQHVAVTADTATGQVQLYLNGKPVALQVVAGSLTVSGQFADVSHLFIGQRQGADTPEGVQGALRYKGLIDEVELYNRALSPSEIQAIFFVGARGKCKP